MGGEEQQQAEQLLYQQSFHTQFGDTSTPNVYNSRDRPLINLADSTRHTYSTSSLASTPSIADYGYAAMQQAKEVSFTYQSEHLASPQKAQQYHQQISWNKPQHAHVQDQSVRAFNNIPPYQRRSTAVEAPIQRPLQANFGQILDRSSTDPNLTTPGSEVTQYSQQQAIQNLFTAHRKLLKSTNSLTMNGQLHEAKELLIIMSQRLVDQIQVLGLDQDVLAEGAGGRAAYRKRLEFWRDFHNCWLAFLQRQFDDTQQSTTRTLNTGLLEQLGDEAVRIGDQLEQYGLVDYEIGFFEKELIPLIIKCIDVLNRQAPYGNELDLSVGNVARRDWVFDTFELRNSVRSIETMPSLPWEGILKDEPPQYNRKPRPGFSKQLAYL